MSTITKEFTKEQLIAKAQEQIKLTRGLNLTLSAKEHVDMCSALFEIALASLEAEPVADVVAWSSPNEERTCDIRLRRHDITAGPLYTAPPAPVSVPDDVMAAIQKVARIRLDLNDFDGDKRGIAESLGEAEEALIEVVNRRAAMLQGAEQQNQQQYIPENIPTTQFKPVADLYEVTVPGGRSTTFTKDAAEASDCRVMGWSVQEYVKLERYQVAMLQGADTELQRKAAIHDALCEKYNVESLADFVDWQRNHIAELEAAPPAPVGPGETAVMPDYPGYVMTQRECYRAGKKAGLAEAGSSPVIPDGYCIMPLKLTANNGAKGALCGEFHVQYRIVCQSCVGEGCEDCNHTGGWDAEIPVGWDTIKRIHEAAVEACAMPAAPQQEISHALAKGMERYGDAMQDLAKKEVK
ncbi:hypothetical protein [Enterobacter mori]|uniref:hypothetical protein n=1 Tax=Enterobacter mori TaxID=539813 RepID=UPI001C67E9DE|nr:hypothetical protein [Enterobacter mori]MBW8246432.1 hypothetical protein [Enterobacter mori]MBW8250747.1 hypothetical protein [Enterobacter mori]